MNFKYPISKEDSTDYNAEELYGILSREKSGHYLLGNHQFWHGGIHFSTETVEQCALKQPIRCIADGEVIAYRINKKYKESKLNTTTLQYSSSFCLVKHEYESPTEPIKTPEKDPSKLNDDWQNKKIETLATGFASYSDEAYSKDRKLMPKGLKLQILQVNNTTKKIGNTEYYLTKAKVLEAAEANATNKTSAYTKDEELWFAAFKKDGSLQSSAPQKTDLFKETIPTPASTNTTETDKKASEDTTKPTTANKTNKLTFYSLYMHLLPYEEYPTSKDEIKRQAKVVTDGLRARDKIIDDKSTQVIGNISKGTLVNILEVREDEAGNNNCAKVTIAENSGKITLVNQQTKKAEEVTPPAEGFWIVLKDKQTNNGKITWRELAKELPLPKREYPSYWAKQVTAKVTLKEMNIRQAPEAGSDIAGATLAVKLKKDDEVTYSNSKVKSLKISGKTYRMAECKLTKNKTEFTEKGITTFWACVENNYMTTINAEPSTFDTVDASNKIKISAGEPVGYLGLYEVPASPTGGKSDKPKKQVHIEVFTLAEEAELKKFLDNEAGLTGGKQYIQIPKGTVLGKQTENTQSSTGADSTPQTNSEKKEAPTAVKQLQDNYYQTKYDHIITPDRAKLVNNKYLVTIYENRQSITGVVAKAKTTSISQYELTKLGFTIIKEENPQADGSVSTTTDDFIEQDKMTPFFQDICKEIDSKDNGGDGDGKLSLPELRSALKDPVLSDKWSKLIAYHPTEWQAKGDDPKWQRLISDVLPGDANKALREHEKERITNLIFWDDVPDLQGKKEAYHFHPVAFVEHLQFKGVGITTFHIFYDGRIEKHIPATIKSGYENKYQYIYHDKNGVIHDICTADWHLTKKKANGVRSNTIPSTSGIKSDNNVSEGNTSRRVIYNNGDIAEYGRHPSYGLIWRLYRALNEDIEIVKMPDQINYSKDDTIIKYNFSNTKRRYTGPGPLAGFIGALADIGLEITTTGSCFSEASCFPSAEHVNGDSVDTLYFLSVERDQNFINAMHKFHFKKILAGSSTYFYKTVNKKKTYVFTNAANGGTLHDSHLHSGNFDSSQIKIVRTIGDSLSTTENNFTIADAKTAIKKIYDTHGKDMAIIIERMYRDETAHFSSLQYKRCGTGGMESFGSAPYYGWDSSFFTQNPSYTPTGTWSAYENKGMSGQGGNTQVTDRKKVFVVLPSVLAGMEYKVFYINKHNGNWARWHSTNATAQTTYKEYIEKITPKFVNEIEASKNDSK